MRQDYLTARAGDAISCSLILDLNRHALRRGDWLKVDSTGEVFPVWNDDGHTITVARGWRRTYVRRLLNPAQRAGRFLGRLPRFCVGFVAVLADGASVRDAASAGWVSSGFGR